MALARMQERVPQNGNGTRPILAEIAGIRQDDIFLGYIQVFDRTLLNPDVILTREAAGRGQDLWDELLRDDQIFSAYQTRRLAVTGKPWDVQAASEDARDGEIAAFVRATLEGIPGFARDCRAMLSAIAKGYSVVEIMWALSPDGRITVADLRGRAQKRFVFDIDNQLRIRTLAHVLDGEPVPPRKFVVMSWGSEDENPYGDALLNKVYWYWWFKKHALKFWVIFSEKFGAPTVVGKYPPNTLKDQQDVLLAACEAFQQEMAVTIPDTMQIDLVEAQRTSSVNTYQDLMTFLDQGISKAILGQTLTMQQGDVGSLALGRVHGDVRQDLVEADAAELQQVLNDQLLRPLVDFNFPGVTAYPRFVIHVEPEEDLKALAERDALLVTDIGVDVSPGYFYDRYDLPEPTPAERAALQASKAEAQARADALLRREPPEARAEARFAAAEETPADRLLEATVPHALDLFGALMAELRRELEAAGSYETARAGLDGALSTAEQAPLADLVHRALLTASLHGHAEVFAQAGRSRFAEPELIFEPLTPEEALRIFSARIPMTREQFDRLSEALRARAFTVARVTSLDLIEAVKTALGRSLAEGTTFRDFLAEIGSVFDRAGVTRVNPYHAETVFRTNLHTAYQDGRWEAFQSPGMDALFPLFEFHTAGDERVRPMHQLLNGVIVRRDDPALDRIRPPLGFNCRCTLTAISAAEARRKGLRPTSVPRTAGPDPGFSRRGR